MDMLLEAYHKPHDGIERGQFPTNVPKIQKWYSYRAGTRPVFLFTVKQIRYAMKVLLKERMIVTVKRQWDIVVTILNYDEWQTPFGSESHTESQSNGQAESQMYNKECIITKNVLTTKTYAPQAVPPSEPSENLAPAYTKESIVDGKLVTTAPTHLHTEKTGEVFIFAKGSKNSKPPKLKGRALWHFLGFWERFGKHGNRAAAAKEWIKIEKGWTGLDNGNRAAEFKQICRAAALETQFRSTYDHTPIYGEGWLSDRRWENEIYQGNEPTPPGRSSKIPHYV